MFLMRCMSRNFIHDRCYYSANRRAPPLRGGSVGVNAGLYMRLCVRIAPA